MMPVYFIVIVSVLALSSLLFVVGEAASLKSDAQTAADAAALAGANELATQLYSADGSTIGLDEAAVRAAAEDYAERNDAELTEFTLNGCGVLVTVETDDELEGDRAEELEVEDKKAEAEAAAAMGPLLPTSGLFGAPVDGPVPAVMRPAAQLAARFGLSVTSTTGGTHEPGSYHYRGLAIDVSNSSAPTPEMAAFFRAAERVFAGRLLELFYDPIGYYYDNNQRVPGQIGGHLDHVHIALMPTGSGSTGGGAAGGALPPIDSSSPSDFDLIGAVAGPQLVPIDNVESCAAGSAGLVGGFSGFVPNASSAQIASAICRIGRAMGVSDKIMLAAFETGIVESGMQNLPGGLDDSAGVFQQRPSQGWGSYAQVTDVAYAARTFFSRAMRADRPGQTAGQLAQDVQRSAYPYKYDQAEGAARALMQRVGCTAGGTST